MKTAIYTTIKALVLLIAGSIILSCTKTTYEQIQKPYNSIERFAIAGYGELDSIKAVIEEESIIIYWDKDADRPEKIRPIINISNGATISPASGEEVAFSETTIYTVTAEDGTTKQYHLKPVFNIAIPVLFSVPVRTNYGALTPIEIQGQYFFAGGDASAIKVYMQRVSDGFEFDIPIDPDKTTSTKIVANLPALTAELDTGMHRLYVKVGDFDSNFEEIRLFMPNLNDRNIMPTIITDITVDNIGDLTLGEEFSFKFKIKEGWQNMMSRYYTKQNLTSVNLGLSPLAGGNGFTISVPLDRVSVSDEGDEVTIKLSPEVFGGYTNHKVYGGSLAYGTSGSFQISFGTSLYPYKFPYTLLPVIRSGDYEGDGATLSLVQQGQTLQLGQELTVNYQFLSEEFETRYQGKLNGGTLIFKNTSTDVYTEVSIAKANITDNGSSAKFILPTSQTAIKGSELVALSFSFGGIEIIGGTIVRYIINPAIYFNDSETRVAE